MLQDWKICFCASFSLEMLQAGTVKGLNGLYINIYTNLILSSGKISLQFFHTAPEFLHFCFVLIRSALRVLQLCDPLPQ